MSQLLQSHDYIVGHLTPSIVLYEPSFEGWLSAVFYVYANRLQDDESLQLIAQDCYVPSLIAQADSVTINEDNAERVLAKLNQLLGRSGMRNILWGFLSEKDHIGTTLFQVVKYAIDYPSRAIMEDLGNLNVLDLVQTVKSVAREKHRMEAFVRFEHTTDDIYFARAIATEPEVLLLDEPCSALDPIATRRVEELMVELKKDYTIALVTHNMQQAIRVADTTAFFSVDISQGTRTGYLVEMGPTAQIFGSPREQMTEDYISGKFS